MRVLSQWVAPLLITCLWNAPTANANGKMCAQQLGATSVSKNFSEAELLEACAGSKACVQVVRHIVELSKVPRGTFSEQRFVAYVQDLVSSPELQNKWRKATGGPVPTMTVQEITIDAEKNVKTWNMAVKLPATGRYNDASLYPSAVLLQAHMDMVHKGVNDEALGRLKEQGPVHDIKDGNLIAKGEETTPGLDNGNGLAILLSYLLNPSLRHPKLELVFTGAEEAGLVGARGFDNSIHQLEALYGINLDSETLNHAVHGSFGASRDTVAGAMVATAVTDQEKIFAIDLKGLAGGHSGVDIHRDRLSANIAAGHLLQKLKAEGYEPRLVYYLNGTRNALGDPISMKTVPDHFQMQVAVQKSAIASELAFARMATEYLHGLADLHTEENPREQRTIEVTPLEGSESALSAASTEQVARVLSNASIQGVIDRDPRYADETLSVNNLGFAEVTNQNQGHKAVEMAIMARSFDTERQEPMAASIVEEIQSAWAAEPEATRGTATRRNIGNYPPWYTQPNSPVVELAEKMGLKLHLIKGGLEPTYLLVAINSLKGFVSLGPNMHNLDRVNEQLELKTFGQHIEHVRRLVHRLAAASTQDRQ